jgi:DNA invertase Pin-like site-specific DNA recombinase
MIIIGYARVSTDGQTLDHQQSALTAAGAERVFAEKVSGAVTDRKALAKALAACGPGDVLLVTRLDRLARSTRDLLNVLDAAGKAGAGFRSLADAWADTTTPHGRLMVTVLGDAFCASQNPPWLRAGARDEFHLAAIVQSLKTLALRS